MGILYPNEKMIVSELNVKAGAIGNGGVKNAFDLYLVKRSEHLFFLVVHMKVVFTFKDCSPENWSFAEKKSFVEQWKDSIEKSWDRSRTLKILPDFGLIKIDFRFSAMIDACMNKHWQVVVTKVPKGTFQTSAVWPGKKFVELDSEDLTLTPKGFDQKQKGSVHEFGHMLGLDDEYQPSSKFAKEYNSVMNRGEVPMARHYSFFTEWLDKKIPELKIGSGYSGYNRSLLFETQFGL